jgi:hypothetical protein
MNIVSNNDLLLRVLTIYPAKVVLKSGTADKLPLATLNMKHLIKMVCTDILQRLGNKLSL